MSSLRFAVLALPFALAEIAASPAALAQNLVANPALVRDLPPPGWLADRRAEWTAHHPVYQATCRTPDVASETEFLNRIVGRDEMLLNLAGHPPEGNSAVAREAQLANRDMGTLRNDIVVADGLVAQLQALPACGAAAAAAPAAPATPAPAAATPSSEAATTPAPAPAPQPAVATPPPSASPPPAPPTPAAAAPAAAPAPEPAVATPPPPAAAPAAAKPPASDGAGTVTLRFDDKLAALTPLSVRAFAQAVEAVRAGKPVRLAIDGCAAGADFAMGSACGERLRSLETMLKDNGVRNPKRLFPDAP